MNYPFEKMTYSDIRHELHNHPGISGDERFAHDLIVERLAAARPDAVHTHVGGFGVVAVWGKDRSLPTIAVRGDIDALPTGHRCGHDGHTTILLQVAEMIGNKELPKGHNIILIFQPEEETGTGSQKILDAGILPPYNIRAIYGFHNLPGFPLGTAILNYHTFAAASTGVIYHLVGRQTHASTPEKGINPGLAIAEIIYEFNRLNSPANASDNKFRQSTLIGIRAGEEAFGTSAGDAEIMFTLRAFTNSTMQQLLADARAIAGEVAAKSSLELSVMLQEPFGATENVSACVDEIEKAAAMLSLPVTYCHEPFRWSEDFGEFLRIFPGAMFGIGSGEKHPELHHPDYDFPDDLTVSAAKLFFQLVKSFQFFSPA